MCLVMPLCRRRTTGLSYAHIYIRLLINSFLTLVHVLRTSGAYLSSGGLLCPGKSFHIVFTEARTQAPQMSHQTRHVEFLLHARSLLQSFLLPDAEAEVAEEVP